VLICVPATGEVEPLKKQYTKLLDAYGCLGVLSLSTGQTAAGELMKKHCYSVSFNQLLVCMNDQVSIRQAECAVDFL